MKTTEQKINLQLNIDWFQIGAEDQIILLANNPLYETGQN